MWICMYDPEPEPGPEPEPEMEPWSEKMSEPEPSSYFPVLQPCLNPFLQLRTNNKVNYI
jgi:hypothetical protein